MTWTETHRRWDVVRELDERLHRDPATPLPWDDDVAALFGSRDRLVAFLRARWELRLQDQPSLTARRGLAWLDRTTHVPQEAPLDLAS